MMIKLSDGCYIAADQVTEIKISDHYNIATVRTKDGIGHKLSAEYGQSIFSTVDKLVKQINAARENHET